MPHWSVSARPVSLVVFTSREAFSSDLLVLKRLTASRRHRAFLSDLPRYKDDFSPPATGLVHLSLPTFISTSTTQHVVFLESKIQSAEIGPIRSPLQYCITVLHFCGV